MESFEGMPKNISDNNQPGAVPEFSRAPLGLSGKNANPQTLHTFQSDLADSIKSGQGSMVKIAMAEHEKHQREKESIDPASKRNTIYIAGGILLVVIAVVLVGYGLYQNIPKTVPISQQTSTLSTIISVDTTDGINVTGLTRNNLAEQIGNEYAKLTPTLGTVTRIVPFTQALNSPQHLLTTEELFTTLQSSIPGEVVRSLDPTFTIGVHAFNGNGLFLAFKTNSYTVTLAGMLTWERSMFDELYKIFNIPITGDNKNLFGGAFKDQVIKNQDSRALVDSKGNVVLFYTFLGEDKSTLIITNNQDTLVEILNRLTANTLRH